MCEMKKQRESAVGDTAVNAQRETEARNHISHEKMGERFQVPAGFSAFSLSEVTAVSLKLKFPSCAWSQWDFYNVIHVRAHVRAHAHTHTHTHTQGEINKNVISPEHT